MDIKRSENFTLQVLLSSTSLLLIVGYYILRSWGGIFFLTVHTKFRHNLALGLNYWKGDTEKTHDNIMNS